MFDLWASSAELHQPCLYRRLDDRLIGSDGIVRKEILTSLDRLFCEHLAAGRASFQMPDQPPAISAEQRFLATSALQKSIRRGDAGGAMRFALQGCGGDPEYVFRRLATIAVEDVGIGNLLAVAMALAVMGNAAMRRAGATDELAAYIAYLLAISPKSRLACDLLSIADYDRRLDPVKRQLTASSIGDLRRAAEDRSSPIAERMIAAWLLAGSSRFRGTTIPRVARPRTEAMRMMTASRMPLMLFYIADRAAGRISDAMFVSMFFVAEMIGAEPDMTIDDARIAEGEMISGVPAAAIDLHTAQGRIALSRFAREHASIAHMLRSVSPGLRYTAIRHGVFIAEGGKLAEQVQFTEAVAIERDAHDAELAFAGIIGPAMQRDFVAAIREGLPRLDAIRVEVLGQAR